MPITVNGSASSAANYDFEVEIPQDWDDFWDNTRADGFDIVVTNAEGEIVTFQFKAGFNLPNRSLSLQVDNYAVTANDMMIAFVYYDNPAQGSSLAGTFTASTPLSAFIYLGAPFGFVVKDVGFRPIGTVPVNIFQKEPDEHIDVWFPVGSALARRRIEYNQRLDFKGAKAFAMEVLNSSKADQPAMYALEELRMINGWARVRIKAGTDNQDFVIRLLMNTTDAEIITFTALLQVRELTAQ